MTENNWYCEECGRHFPDQQLFKKHQTRIHIKKEVNCPECGEMFNSKQKMYNHKRLHKVKVPSVTCDECGETVKTGSLWKHKNNKHKQNVELSCNKCEYVTNDQGNLVRHINDYCGKVVTCWS